MFTAFRRHAAAAVVASLSIGAASVAADPYKLVKKTPAQVQFDKGLAALGANDLAAAESAFTQSLKLNSKLPGALLGLAQVASRRGDKKGFASYLQQAYNVAPDSAEVQHNWGKYQYSEGKVNEAAAAYQKAIQLDPKAAGPRVDLADLYLVSFKKQSEAIALFKEAIAIDPKHSGARYALGVALAASGDDAGAIASLKEAAALSPNNPMPLYEMGRVYRSKGRLDAALASYNDALKVSPKYVPALFERANVLAEKGDDDDAVREYRAALAINPNFPDAHVRIGMIQQKQHKTAEAEASYRSAIRLDKNQAIAYNNMAWLAAERKSQLENALTWARQAVTIAPAVPQFQTTLGWVYHARGELPKAAETLTKAASMTPPRAEPFYYLAIVQTEQGKRTEAAASLKKALSIDAKFSEADDARQRLKTLESK